MTCAVKCFQNTAKVLRDLQEPVKIFVTKLPVANQHFVSDVADQSLWEILPHGIFIATALIQK